MKIVTFLILILSLTGLSACGIKPKALKTPDGEQTQQVTYPDLKTDPKADTQ